MESKFAKLFAVSLATIHIVAFSGLVYRSSFYEHIPVAAGDAYGLGDVIDLLFSFMVVAIWCCAFLSAVVLTLLNFKNNWLSSLKLLLFATVAVVGYFYVKGTNLII